MPLRSASGATQEVTEPAELRVSAVLLERLYRIAKGDLDHTNIEGYLGPRHALACDRCDTLAEIRKVLNG